MKSYLAGVDALTIGALLGAIGVVLGAFGSHMLEERLDPEKLDAYHTAVRYQMIHALLLVAIGLAATDLPGSLVGLFVGGVVLFSGSIYGLVLTGWWVLGPVTPIGGTLLIVAWGWLAVWGFLSA